jgi:hypothetical protein
MWIADNLLAPPQLNSPRGRIFTLDKCNTAKITQSMNQGHFTGQAEAQRAPSKPNEDSLTSKNTGIHLM